MRLIALTLITTLSSCQSPSVADLEFKDYYGKVTTVKVDPADVSWDQGRGKLLVCGRTAKRCPGLPATQVNLRLLSGGKCYLNSPLTYSISSQIILNEAIAVIELTDFGNESAIRNHDFRIRFGVGFPYTTPPPEGGQTDEDLTAWICAMRQARAQQAD
jgi:hypothetical protein